MARLNSIKCLKDIGSQKTHELLVLGMFEGSKSNFTASCSKSLSDSINEKIVLDTFTGKEGKMLSCYGDKSIKRWVVVGFGDKKKFNTDKLRAIAANVVLYANKNNLKSLSLDAKSLGLSKENNLQSLCEGMVLGSYEFLNYKSKIENENSLETAFIIGSVDSKVVDKGFAIGESVSFARDLGNHPPNIQTPAELADSAVKIAKKGDMKSTVYDFSQFKKMGLGSFYGVAMGSKETPAKMIIVEYNGGKKSDKPFALVGKGLTFDSGGISIKPSPNMDEMKFDMCGSAVVLGVMKAVATLKPKINIIFAVGATENMPDGIAQRPGDIVTAYNGKTIEVLNTDAEGRLVLADVLSYVVDKYKPCGMLDFATLTGAVLIALGNRASGLMTNDQKLLKEVFKASDKTGEKVWELPLWDDYSKDIKSKIADIKNLGNGRLAGTITAGAFLKEFVGDTPWVHFDIAGTAWGPKEPSYQPKNGATGVAVRLVYSLLEARVK